MGSETPCWPAGGRSCVPAQLAAWPEVSQHWCGQAGGRGLRGRIKKWRLPAPVSWLNKLPEMPATSVFYPWMSSTWLLPRREALRDQQVGLTKAPLELLLLHCVPERLRFFVHPLRMEFISHSPLALLNVRPAGLQGQTLWGLFSRCRASSLESHN